MKQCLFSSGSEQANLVVTSGLLPESLKAILELSKDIPSGQSPCSSLRSKIFQVGKLNILAFVTSPPIGLDQLKKDRKLVLPSSSTAEESFALFKSLNKTKFAINSAVITLFDQHRDQLSQLKNQIDSSVPLIITGCSLGGAIASLFTLWLLESGTFTKAKPLCITFGSPLIGDSGLQSTLVKFSWNSYFLHLASDQDPVPRIFIDQNGDAGDVHKPFGTFLLCSKSGCSCFEDPESILDLLVATASQRAANQEPDHYTQIVESLQSKALIKDNSDTDSASSPFKASIITQLSALGITSQSEMIDIDTLVEKMEKQERKFMMGKNKSSISHEKLNDYKIFMTYMEWYKKLSKDKNIGYYDSFKNKLHKRDMDVDEFGKRLTNYWTDMVEEEEKKPRKGKFASKGFLFGATNYRRMIEPLHIAKYYNEKRLRDYETKGRDRHFILLEQWLQQWQNEQQSPLNDGKRKMEPVSLTEDSCFWAKVEEAILSCKFLKENTESSAQEKESSKEKLKKFENYVRSSLEEKSVSPEIFLKGSSFMQWWKAYNEREVKEAMGRSYTSPLKKTMEKYERYAKGQPFN